jgi:hypothetical protein
MDEDLRAALTAIENRLARIESRVDAIPVLLPSLRDRPAVHQIRCKKTGEPLAIKLDGGWCVCPPGICKLDMGTRA